MSVALSRRSQGIPPKQYRLQTNINNMKNDKINAEGDGAFSSFRDFWNAIVSFRVKNMGVRAVLEALLQRARRTDKTDKLGLETTLRCYQNAEQLQDRALSQDPIAFAELYAMATVMCAMVAEVADEHPEMVRPFARASATWPILQPCFEWTKEGSPQDRLRALGFGKDAKGDNGEKLRRFNSGCGLVALLLHVYRILRAVAAGDFRTLDNSCASLEKAEMHWRGGAKVTLDDAVEKLSDLPIQEVAKHRACRRDRRANPKRDQAPEVSGDVRFEIKKWYVVRMRPLVCGWLNVAKSRMTKQ